MRSTRTAPTTSPGRVWLITGASRGLGYAFATAALERGDSVVGVARRTAALDELAASHEGRVLALTVDVTDRVAVFAAVAAAVEHFGTLDVVVNNAGTLTLGMVEEFGEDEARTQMETNFFGALWVSQAAVAQLRGQRHGHLVQISSIGALGGYPATGLYSASKWALEGMSEALALEAAPFGVKLTIVEPGGYWTDLYSSMRQTTALEAYAPLRAQLDQQYAEASVDSDPRLAAEALMTLVDSDDPPLRLLLGSVVFDMAMDVSRARMRTWASWESVSRGAECGIPMPGREAVPAGTSRST